MPMGKHWHSCCGRRPLNPQASPADVLFGNDRFRGHPLHGRWWELPPMILYPFGRGLNASAVLDSMKLTLHLNGMGEPGLDKEPLLRGRYAEFRMLSLVGKDVMRWIAQCADFIGRDDLLAHAGIRPPSFADLLLNRTPPAVAARLETWGVSDYRRVVSRAITCHQGDAVYPVGTRLVWLCAVHVGRIHKRGRVRAGWQAGVIASKVFCQFSRPTRNV
jgi:hypothetical protein